VPESTEAAAHDEKEYQDDKQDAYKTHSAGPVITAAVSIKAAAPEQQKQHNNQ
jgi:hypothetical protein